MAYSGKFSPQNPKKYRGDPTNIIFRSLWERRVMVYLDQNTTVLEWNSEEIIIPYLSPVDNRWHRYFPDFWVRTKDGVMIIEVKPEKQGLAPQVKKRATKKYINEVVTYGVNMAKWKAADEYCLDRGWKFKAITLEENAFREIKWK